MASGNGVPRRWPPNISDALVSRPLCFAIEHVGTMQNSLTPRNNRGTVLSFYSSQPFPMKTFLSRLSIASVLTVASPAFAADILTADSWTKTTNRYLSGAFESRLDEVATNPMTAILDEFRRMTLEGGVKLHCALNGRQIAANEKCVAKTSIRGVR